MHHSFVAVERTSLKDIPHDPPFMEDDVSRMQASVLEGMPAELPHPALTQRWTMRQTDVNS